ncbi:hypothetical protein K0U83_13220 [bacterium]|jgi:hypothetical protein|nr:hypothetical protein [bacterium]
MASVTVDFIVTTAAGRPAYTSPDKDIAHDWLFERRAVFPGAYIRQVTTTVEEVVVYKPRLPKAQQRAA